MTACDWNVSYASCTIADGATYPVPLESMSASGVAQIEQLAVDYLWNWTGQSLGLCEVELRPCRADCQWGVSTFYGSGPTALGIGGALWRPVIINGLWYNIGCGRCGDSCSCTYVPSLKLPGPVNDIIEVVIDGEVLDSSAYRVDNRRILVRQDGGDWPACNDLSLPAGEDGTWTVKYHLGAPVPVGGQVAAGVLAVELAKALCRDKTCALPQRVQTVTRQDVTIAVLDAFEGLDKGYTGIWIVDSWIASLMRRPARSRVLSPDVRRPRKTTWP